MKLLPFAFCSYFYQFIIFHMEMESMALNQKSDIFEHHLVRSQVYYFQYFEVMPIKIIPAK
jgi:hypothetical protein